ncbi:MAG: hypothetical protein Q8R81_04015 [Novosphingobium sp.]|nr:hypothetical protein [Novosphingobium sp.]
MTDRRSTGKEQDETPVTVTKRKPKPITAHPMFPAVTALWFAAFLSLGSFAVAPALLEGPVVALGIPEILPAAQPPLGFTVRALVAIVMMGVGGLVGYMIGRRLAHGHVEAPVRARSFGRSDEKAASPARPPLHRRPLNPSEDLGDPLTGAAFAPPSVFAAASDVAAPLAETDEHTVLEVARLPWEDERSDSAQRGTLTDDALADDPLALDLLFEDAEIVAEEAASGERQEFTASADVMPEVGYDADEPVDEAFEPEVPAQAADFTTNFADPAPAYAAMPLIKTPLMQAPAAVHMPLARTPLEDLGLVQLTERLALAIGRRNARAHAAPQNPAPTAPYAVHTVEAFVPAPAADPVHGSDPESGIRDFDGFSVAAPQPSPVLARFQSAVADDADADNQAPSLETERVVQLRPAALQPFVAEFDAEEDEDVPGLARFLRVSTQQPTSEPVDACDEEDEFDDEEDGDAASDFVESVDANADPDVPEERYPSLLDMSSGSNRHQALQLSNDDEGDEYDADARADDAEPVVVFPGQSAPIHAAPRPFERPSAMGGASDLPTSIIPVPGSPLASPGRAAPSSPIDTLAEPVSTVTSTIVEAEEADRALRAALATLQRMTAQG